MDKVAVFALLQTAGVSAPSTVGDWILTLQQKLGRLANSPVQTYSKPEDVPAWWE
eukprot:CAMPEP_0171307158 /NCGR_PEP_ID=MMETSP0816-20121228/17170_1 /TAXON_ID=420281 /ORGANISM="Proboscia inermis, Strain CCAP1064/1" /LENGTH=54 /DNA_ID=CAMNT_0011789157 /DNA_START=1 /DNA_END=162 /DNA_ORIENTATION=+